MKRHLFALALLVSIAAPAFAATYYISPAGDDANPGTEALPWRTIAKATATLVAGDTVFIRSGTYHELVSIARSGTSSAWITYAAYPGEAPVIDGTALNVPAYSGLVDLTNVSFIRISGLTVTNAGSENTSAGINVDNCDSVIVENNKTVSTRSSGIGVWGSRNVTVSANDVRLAVSGGQNECLSVGGTDGFEVMGNRVHDPGPNPNGGEGICIKDGSANGKVHHNEVWGLQYVGLYLDAWDKHTSNIEVYANRVHDMVGAEGMAVASEMGGLLENVRIYNNLSYNNGFNGLNFGWYGGPGVLTHPLRTIKVINNTFYNNGRSGWGGGIALDNRDAQDVVLRNNIISQNASFQIVASVSIAGLAIDHNLIDGFRGYDAETRGTDAQEAAAGFTNAAANDFRPLATSAAIDHGSSVDAPSVDFDGTARPLGSTFDIGAYERTVSLFNADADGVVTAGDVFCMINALFGGGSPPPGPADANGSGSFDVADVFYVINHLFCGGPPPR